MKLRFEDSPCLMCLLNALAVVREPWRIGWLV